MAQGFTIGGLDEGYDSSETYGDDELPFPEGDIRNEPEYWARE